MERCKYELFVENYFGFNTDEVITEKTKITTDFGQLVNLLAMFDNERALAETSHENGNCIKPDVSSSVCKCPYCATEMKGIELTHYRCKNCNLYFTN